MKKFMVFMMLVSFSMSAVSAGISHRIRGLEKENIVQKKQIKSIEYQLKALKKKAGGEDEDLAKLLERVPNVNEDVPKRDGKYSFP